MPTNKQNTHANKLTQTGVTLVELMIVVAILSILLTVVAPNMQSFLIKNRITGELNKVSAIIQYARHAAIDQQTTIVVCPSADFNECGTNWNNPKIVFIDSNADGDRNNSEDLLVTTTKSSNSTTMTGPNASIEFEDSGGSTQAFDIQICPNNNDAEYARAISVSLQGRVKVSSDSDADNIHETIDGTVLTCT